MRRRTWTPHNRPTFRRAASLLRTRPPMPHLWTMPCTRPPTWAARRPTVRAGTSSVATPGSASRRRPARPVSSCATWADFRAVGPVKWDAGRSACPLRSSTRWPATRSTTTATARWTKATLRSSAGPVWRRTRWARAETAGSSACAVRPCVSLTLSGRRPATGSTTTATAGTTKARRAPRARTGCARCVSGRAARVCPGSSQCSTTSRTSNPWMHAVMGSTMTATAVSTRACRRDRCVSWDRACAESPGPWRAFEGRWSAWAPSASRRLFSTRRATVSTRTATARVTTTTPRSHAARGAVPRRASPRSVSRASRCRAGPGSRSRSRAMAWTTTATGSSTMRRRCQPYPSESGRAYGPSDRRASFSTAIVLSLPSGTTARRRSSRSRPSVWTTRSSLRPPASSSRRRTTRR